MTVLEYGGALLSRLEGRDDRAGTALLERDPERERPVDLAAVVSPELVLVAPPEIADAAREALPEPTPFDEWLRQVRAAEARAEPVEWDWEFARSEARLEGSGLAFGLVLAAVSALPVVLLALSHAV